MPVTIQPATLKYKNSNGVYQSADCLKGEKGNPGAAGNAGLIAPDYDDLTFPVQKGQHCTYDSKYYEANQNISTSESFTASHWNEWVNIGNEIESLKSQNEVISDNLEGKIFWNETAVTLLMQILDKAVYSQDMSAQREALAEELEYVPVTGWTITNVLTGITNSNTATSVSNGASYSATLTATDSSKNVGTITVTMGGTDISSTAVSSNVITIASVTGDIVITCAAVTVETLVPAIANPPDYTTFEYSKNSYAYSFIYEVGSITGGKLTCTFDNTLAYDFNAALYIFDSNGDPYEFTPYKKPENYKFSGEWNPYYVEPGEGSSFPVVSDSFSVNIPTGCKAFVFVRPGLEVHYDGVTITGDTAFRTWAMNGGITVTVEG